MPHQHVHMYICMPVEPLERPVGSVSWQLRCEGYGTCHHAAANASETPVGTSNYLLVSKRQCSDTLRAILMSCRQGLHILRT